MSCQLGLTHVHRITDAGAGGSIPLPRMIFEPGGGGSIVTAEEFLGHLDEVKKRFQWITFSQIQSSFSGTYVDNRYC